MMVCNQAAIAGVSPVFFRLIAVATIVDEDVTHAANEQEMKLTIRTLLAAVAFAAFAIGTVTIGPPVSWIAAVLYTLFLVAKLIDCFVSKSERRVFANGLCIAAFAYLAMPIFIGSNEFTASDGLLPTSRVLQSQIRPEILNFNDFATTYARAENARSVMPAGHLAIAIFFGYIGGLYAVFSYRRVGSIVEADNRELVSRTEATQKPPASDD